MSTTIEDRVRALEDFVATLRQAVVGGARSTDSSAGGPSAPTRVEALADGLLDNAWADAKIDKDPPQYKGRTQVGRRYSLAPVEWLESAAGFFEWKAKKGREETPVRLQASGKNAGKPWHEADTFKAKLLRAWAKRNANKPKAAPKQEEPEDDFGAPVDDFGADDEVPF